MMTKRIKELEKISRIKGIRELILTDGSRVISSRGTKEAEKKARALLRCAGKAGHISGSGFHYLLFSRENQAHLLVFPAGTYTLGIIQEKGADSIMLANRIKTVLKDIEFDLS